MKKRTLSLVLALSLIFASNAQAAVIFVNLGTTAPPANVGPYPMLPFNTVPQAAIVDLTPVTVIPGSPISGSLTTGSSVLKRTVPATWGTWSHGYTGPVFHTATNAMTLTLPTGAAGAGAFYFYAEGDNSGTFNITATTNFGGTSGAIAVNSSSGATGFGFYTTTPGESLTTISITADAGAGGFAVGEFGIAEFSVVPTMGDIALFALLLMTLAVATMSMRRRQLAV